MLGTRRCDFVALLAAGGVVASPLLTARAQEPATMGVTAASPQIEIARAKPVDAMPPGLRLSDGHVDLMKNFSLSSLQGVGDAWEIPPYIAPPDAFDERYGQW